MTILSLDQFDPSITPKGIQTTKHIMLDVFCETDERDVGRVRPRLSAGGEIFSGEKLVTLET